MCTYGLQKPCMKWWQHHYILRDVWCGMLLCMAYIVGQIFLREAVRTVPSISSENSFSHMVLSFEETFFQEGRVWFHTANAYFGELFRTKFNFPVCLGCGCSSAGLLFTYWTTWISVIASFYGQFSWNPYTIQELMQNTSAAVIGTVNTPWLELWFCLFNSAFSWKDCIVLSEKVTANNEGEQMLKVVFVGHFMFFSRHLPGRIGKLSQHSWSYGRDFDLWPAYKAGALWLECEISKEDYGWFGCGQCPWLPLSW